MKPKHNNQIKKDARSAPIIKGVMCTVKVETLEKDVLMVASDALIYSTNTRLSMSGGVGAALVKEFGSEIQTRLINQGDGFGMELASVGDVICEKTRNMPWKLVLHTVCTDGSYIASCETIKKVLVKALVLCDRTKEVSSVSISELGTGYGSMERKEFNRLLLDVLSEINLNSIQKVTVCTIPGAKH